MRRSLQKQGSSHARRGRSRLDPEPTLAGTPEKSLRPRVEAIDWQPVGGEAAQASPFPLHRLDRPVNRLLEAIDRDRHILLLWLGIAGIAHDFIVRTQP